MIEYFSFRVALLGLPTALLRLRIMHFRREDYVFRGIKRDQWHEMGQNEIAITK